MISEKLSIIHSVDGGSVYPECAYTIVMITFLLVVVVCLFFSACFLFLSIQRKIIDNKKFASEQTEDYYQGYIQGAIDRKTEYNNDVIFNRINQVNGSVHGNSRYLWTVTYGPKPVIPPLPSLPTNNSLANKRLVNKRLANKRRAYLQGYIDGHKDDKFWDK